MPTLPATEEKAQGSHTFAARWQIDQGDCFVGSRLVSQTNITTVRKNKGLDRVVNISIDSQGFLFRERCPSPSLPKTQTTKEYAPVIVIEPQNSNWSQS